jgi:hypothetical protein
MSEKHEAFVRLSAKRLETIEDAIRIWSNLSGPSYQFSTREVHAGIERIQTGVLAAYERFKDSKCWRDQEDAPEVPAEAPEEAAGPDPVPESPTVPETGITARQREMLRIWDEPRNEEGALLEMLAMQREVIAHLQATIDGKDQA